MTLSVDLWVQMGQCVQPAAHDSHMHRFVIRGLKVLNDRADRFMAPHPLHGRTARPMDRLPINQ